jgi:hypothetical protein
MAITDFPPSSNAISLDPVYCVNACAGENVMTKLHHGMLGTVGLLLAVLPTTALADLRGTPEQRAACMGDAIMLCSHAIPNRARIASCLGSKMSRLSPRCRAQFLKHENAAR